METKQLVLNKSNALGTGAGIGIGIGIGIGTQARHSRAGGNPQQRLVKSWLKTWIPACAGMTVVDAACLRSLWLARAYFKKSKA
ncbi:MAG: hypothetical protein KBH24_06925 [Brachymonas sp.]|nr:hypothetical protein [Brachymonas sp.]MBP8747516.1 hypothetical protein [Brachymonas sp.]